MQKISRGVALLEIGLIIMLVVSIGSVGWHWWHGKKIDTSTTKYAEYTNSSTHWRNHYHVGKACVGKKHQQKTLL